MPPEQQTKTQQITAYFEGQRARRVQAENEGKANYRANYDKIDWHPKASGGADDEDD